MRQLRPMASILLVLTLLLSVVAPAAAEMTMIPVSVVVDGNKLQADAYIINGRTVAPLRAIFEAVSATIEWNGETRTATARRGTKVIQLTVDNTEALVDGKAVTLAIPPMLINARIFVPVRFIGEALDMKVAFDPASTTVTVDSGTDCNLSGGQLHKGTIHPGGETWGLCGSPHIVSGDFRVEGKDSPVLVIEAGAVVRFESDAQLTVGFDAPGGLMVNGTADKPVVLTADSAGAQPGFWSGIAFGKQTVRDMAVLAGARIEYAGGPNGFGAALALVGDDQKLEVLVKHLEIRQSAKAGVLLSGGARLSSRSENVKISGTDAVDGKGGYPFITEPVGSHLLPKGEYFQNAFNAVLVTAGNTAVGVIGTDTTWRNIGVPYAVESDLMVEGPSHPTLKIEPGVVTLWKADTELIVGENAPGALVADAGVGDQSLDRSVLKGALNQAKAFAANPATTALTADTKAIVFAGWNPAHSRGIWNGIRLMEKAGDKTRLVGTVIADAGRSDGAALTASAYSSPVKFLLKQSMVGGSLASGVELQGQAEFLPGSTGNALSGSAWPLQVPANQIGTIETGNLLTGNDSDQIRVAEPNVSFSMVERTQTWQNHGVPYYFAVNAHIAGDAGPVVTVEPGTTLLFAPGTWMEMGTDGKAGSLVAVGTKEKPITFSSDRKRPGAWQGLVFTEATGADNRLEYTVVEFATRGIALYTDLGPILTQSIVRSNKEVGVERAWYDGGGTDFTSGSGNTFKDNGEDQTGY